MRISNSVIALGAFLSLTASACSSGEIEEPADYASQSRIASSQAAVERPWRGECDVTAEFISEFTIRITGSCQLAHVGQALVIAYQTITPGPNGIAYTNTAVYRAPDGDELRTTNVGLALRDADALSLSGTETAVGGTGRFVNASGSAALTGAVRFTGAATTIGSYSLIGHLTY